MQPYMKTYSDTRFSHGMWHLRDDISIDWAVEPYKVEKTADASLRSVISTKQLVTRGTTVHCPTITTKLHSAGDGIVGFDATHHVGKAGREPRFALEKSNIGSVTASDSSDLYTLTSGDIAAEFDANGKFGVRFNGPDGKLLTKLGYRSVGYVRDFRDKSSPLHRPFMTVQMHLSVGEKVYGLGERFGPLTKNGQRVEMWHENAGTLSDQAYKNIPFYMTNRGYGVFVDSTSFVSFEVQSERTTRVNIVVPGEQLRLYVIYGPTPKDILAKYTHLTGRPALPPAWTFGLWLSTSFTTSYDLSTVSSFIQGMKDRDIPLSTFHFDCFWMKAYQWCDFEFDEGNFPDPKAFLSVLKEKFGLRVCLWLNSYIAQESALFDEGMEKGYLIKRTDGSPYQVDFWQAGMGIVDFTNPEATKWYQSRLEKLVDLGADSFKTDFGESIPVLDVKYHNNNDPASMHNYYTHLYNKAVFEVLQKKKGTGEACLFARSATAGGQTLPVHWGGDCECTFGAMAETLRGGLSLSSSGFGFWSHDIGGFQGAPDTAVYKRWVPFGLLSSHSRLHGNTSYRVPWEFDDEASGVLQKFTKLKLSLMPYIYAAAIEAHDAGIPVMRATYLEFPDDVEAWNSDCQYFLGDSLLVAPVFTEDGSVTFYTPAGGDWYGYLDGKLRKGGLWHQESHDFLSLPLLVRPGSAFIVGACDSAPEYKWNDGFTVNVYDATSRIELLVPDSQAAGSHAGKVVITPDGNTLVFEVTGDIGSWSVKILASKVDSVIGGSVSSTDELNNSVISADSTKLTVKLSLKE